MDFLTKNRNAHTPNRQEEEEKVKDDLSLETNASMRKIKDKNQDKSSDSEGSPKKEKIKNPLSQLLMELRQKK